MAKLSPLVKAKVCGTTCLKDALFAVECGADAIGFIFYKKSPRSVTAKTAKDICAKLPPFVNRVGVFVNETVEKINQIVDRCGLDTVQLHGDESPTFCKKIKPRVIKAVRMKNAASLKEMSRYEVDGFLLDTYKEDRWGGTGKVFDWELAACAKKYGPVIIAGGLNPRNVKVVIQKVQQIGRAHV